MSSESIFGQLYRAGKKSRQCLSASYVAFRRHSMRKRLHSPNSGPPARKCRRALPLRIPVFVSHLCLDRCLHLPSLAL